LRPDSGAGGQPAATAVEEQGSAGGGALPSRAFVEPERERVAELGVDGDFADLAAFAVDDQDAFAG